MIPKKTDEARPNPSPLLYKTMASAQHTQMFHFSLVPGEHILSTAQLWRLSLSIELGRRALFVTKRALSDARNQCKMNLCNHWLTFEMSVFWCDFVRVFHFAVKPFGDFDPSQTGRRMPSSVKSN